MRTTDVFAPTRPVSPVGRPAGGASWIALLLCVLLGGCAGHGRQVMAGPGDSGERSLHETAAAHLAAIHARDLDALLATVTGADSLVLILPDGTTTFTRGEYVAFHQAWFGDPSWAMEFQPLATVFRDGVAILLFRTTYTDARGSRPGLVSLTFARERGGWRLIFDQNTRL